MMIEKTKVRMALLAGACTLAAAACGAQQTSNPGSIWRPATYEVAATFSPEHAQQAGNGNSFWLEGGGLDATASYANGFGLTVAIDGERASNVTPGIDVNKLAFLAGPRYTAKPVKLGKAPGNTKDARTVSIFVEALAGGMLGFNGIYPSASGISSSGSSFAVEAGGGINLNLTPRYAIRLAQADYVRSSLANSASSNQNDLRLACGFVVRFGK